MQGVTAVLIVGLTLASLAPVRMPVAGAQEAMQIVQERRTPTPGAQRVQHLAVVRNVSSRPVRGLRVTVELYDFFGALLWAQTVSPRPAALRPGETASLAVTTPALPAHRRTRYRFEYR